MWPTGRTLLRPALVYNREEIHDWNNLLTGLEDFPNDQPLTKQIELSVLHRSLTAIVKKGEGDEQRSVILLDLSQLGDGFNVNKMIANRENKLEVILHECKTIEFCGRKTFESVE